MIEYPSAVESEIVQFTPQREDVRPRRILLWSLNTEPNRMRGLSHKLDFPFRILIQAHTDARRSANAKFEPGFESARFETIR
jgi:hypothetical protein